MQQCTSCGTELTAEEMVCPYCNTPNISYVPARKAHFEGLDLLAGSKASSELYASSAQHTYFPPKSHTLGGMPVQLASPRDTPVTKISRRTLLFTSLISLCVIALGVLGSRAYYTNIYYPNQLHSQATATADSATATAYVGVTTTTSTDTPQSIYTNTTGATPTFTDSLASEDTSDWASEIAVNGDTCSFENQAFQIKINSTNTFFPCYGQHLYSNFIFKVRMTIITGDGGVILFRAANDTQDKYYALFIHPTGQFSLDVYKSASSNDTRVLGKAYLSGFNTGLNQMNSIAILAYGNTFSLFVNEHYVIDIVDGNQTYSQGIFALGAFENKLKTTVAFNYVQIWSL